MKSFVLALIIFLVCNISFAQNKTSSDTTRKKTSQTKISEGASGVRRSIGYKFSSTVTDADPGEGIFRYNNPSVSKVTWVFVDDTDISGEDQTKWYSTWDDTTGATSRGSINMVEHEGENMILFNITGVFVKTKGYWKFPVEYISGALPVNGSTYYYVFNRIAHKKPQTDKESQPAVVQQVTVQPKPAEVPPAVLETPPAVVQQVTEQPKPEEAQPVVQETPPAVVQQVTEQPKPAEVPVVVQEPQPAVVHQVTEQPKPAEVPQTGQQTQTVQATQTRETTKFSEARRPATVTGTTQTAKPAQTAEAPKTTQMSQTTQAKPVTQTTEPAKKVQPVQQTQPGKTTQTTQTAQNTQNTQNTQNYQPAPYNQVSQVTKPTDIPNPYANADLSGSSSKRKCYRGIIELGYAWGVGDYGVNNFRFNFINGIMIGRSSSIGLGLGYRRYFEKDFSDKELFSPLSQTPVFIDLRTSFSTKKVTPYLALQFGGSASYLKVNSDSITTRQEGLYFCPSGGIWFNISSRFAVFAGVAYELQRLEYVLIADDSHFRRNSSSVSLNVGIAF